MGRSNRSHHAEVLSSFVIETKRGQGAMLPALFSCSSWSLSESGLERLELTVVSRGGKLQKMSDEVVHIDVLERSGGELLYGCQDRQRKRLPSSRGSVADRTHARRPR